MSPDTLPTSSPSSPIRNRSLLSKFSNRFGHRNRNISEFYVQPDDPWKTYSPGDVVTGAIVLTVVKPVRITHLVVCLHGYVKVFKHAVAPGEAAGESGFLGPGRGKRTGEYLGNGFASLFEDEVVLCGEGRLKEGIYKFRFELEFPDRGLPSSINFERGTISYMITSTLTRPTTILPTVTCDKRIILLESIDIADLSPPKPRIISLEPVSKKSKSKTKSKTASSDQISPSSNNKISQERASTSSAGDARPPLSPVPSEQSNSSCITNSTQSFQVINNDGNSTRCQSMRTDESQPSQPSQTSQAPTKHQSITITDQTTITATTELLRAGALPGDVLPVKVTITHNKPIRSPHGVIITLYRQGRIDLHPQIPVGFTEKGKKPVYEDYYPKSRTGLGGLTFGTASASSVFRKDLSQTFSPLIIDPVPMTAVVKSSIRIPEDSFPTISRVPGSMLSFRYYVEIVLDLRGKLAGQDRFLPRLNMINSTNNYSNDHNWKPQPKGKDNVAAPWSPQDILDTAQLRREKRVVACVFEVTVGSKDTGRGHINVVSTPQHQRNVNQRTKNDAHGPENSVHCGMPDQQLLTTQGELSMDDQQQIGGPDEPWPSGPPSEPYPHLPMPEFIPDEEPEPVDEKARLRRAEELLLPSAPEQEHDSLAGPSAPAPTPQATAPIIPENELADQYGAYIGQVGERGLPLETPPPFDNRPLGSATSIDTITSHSRTIRPDESSSSPPSPCWPIGPHRPRENAPTGATDDKQELERRRLLREASAPEPEPNPSRTNASHDNDNNNTNSNGHNDTLPPELTPTAPILTEEDIMNNSHATAELLPRYQR